MAIPTRAHMLDLEQQIVKLRAENVRLRAALAEIAALGDVNADEAMGIAGRALRLIGS